MNRALKLYAHAGPRPRALFVVRRADGRCARTLAPLELPPSLLTGAGSALHIARARTELGLCAQCEHILGSSRRVAIDVQRELVYCLDCWSDIDANSDARGKDSLP